MNYHFQPNNRKAELLRELSKVDNELKTDHKSLQRLKLEQQFYEDKGKNIAKQNMALADEIMGELIAGPAPLNNYYKPIQELPPFANKPQEYRPASIKQEYRPPPSQAPQNERQNNFINDRQIQKIKMQNQKHQGLFPSSSDHNRVRSFGKQPQILPENDNNYELKNVQPISNNRPVKKTNSPEAANNFNPNFNPFVKADQLLKQKREENQRQYLKELEMQRQEQQRIKEEREKQKKMMKGQYYDFLPPPKQQPEKPIIMKKNDPNSKPPKIQQQMGNYSQFDSNLIKSKAIEIKSKYKKGKITYEQCQREINNLKKQYNGNLDDLIADNISAANRSQKEPQQLPNQKLKLYKEESPKKQYFEQEDKKQPNFNNFPIKNQSINYSQFMPSMVPQQEQLPQRSSLNYSLPQQNMMANYPMMSLMNSVPANIPQEYMQLMRKMFEVCMKEVKEAYSQRLDHQDKAYQQTLNKFLQHSQNNFMTQQIPPIQTSQQQKQFYSDAKQAREYFEKESNIKRKNPVPSAESLANIPFGQSDNSEYYDKSLSGIASKIPYNNPISSTKVKPKTEKQEKILKESGLHQFYNRKYKVKKQQHFSFTIELNQTNFQIPSTSTYLRSKNALQQLQIRFHQDLAELKKLQSQKNFTALANKMTKNTAYFSQRRILKDPQINPVQSSNPYTSKSPLNRNQNQQNPFLKKHVSNDDNIMTFNQKDLKLNSPINSYSPKSKKQILEQDEYQTEPRVREETKVPSYIQEYEQRFNMPNKALNFIRANNQILNKYEQTEKSKKQAIMIRDQSEVKSKQSNYFTNNDISPVKKSENYYEESLQTIRSDFESAQHSRRPIKAIDSANQANIERSNSKEQEKPIQVPNPTDMIGYSQTVESIEESSIKNSRPPVAKRRQISKKKESSIARSKINPDSSISKGYNNDSLEVSQMPKFDSNVYESQYEQSADFAREKKINPQLIKNVSIEQGQSQPNIEIYTPTIIAPKSALEIEMNHSSYSPKSGSAKLMQPQGKLKSLEEARKLAKQYRAKANDESKQYKSVEERFSELESFMTKRCDESIHSIRKDQADKIRQKSKQKSGKGKRDIMKMLEQLEDDEEDYKQDFESYREQSEQYQ